MRRVLPTSPEDGLIECIPSTALARVLAEHKSIHRYWALYNADPSGALNTQELATWAEVATMHCQMVCLTGHPMLLKHVTPRVKSLF